MKIGYLDYETMKDLNEFLESEHFLPEVKRKILNIETINIPFHKEFFRLWIEYNLIKEERNEEKEES